MNILVERRQDTGWLAGSPELAHVVRKLAIACRRAGLTVRLWSARSEQRRRLRGLAVSQFADMGLSQEDVMRETRKHFWPP